MPVDRINEAVARRPALPVVVLFILGIAAHRTVPILPLIWIAAIGVLLICAILLRRRGALASLAIVPAVLLTGACTAQLADFRYPSNDIGLFASDDPKLASVEGEIADEPRLIEPAPFGRPLPEKQSLSLRVRTVRTWNGWIGATGTLPVTISPPVWELAPGQVIRLLGRIERPRPAMNPGGFDTAEHYRRQRVLAAMHVSRPYDVQIVSRPAALTTPLTNVRNASRNLLDRGFDVGHASDRALLRALVFGDREPDLQAVQDDFVHSGTTHLLAANGSRIALLAGAIYLLCRLLRVRPDLGVWALTIMVALFGFLTMPAAQAIRPAVACVAVGFGVLNRRRMDSLQALSLVAIAVLVPRPLDLYGAGFQLSFTIVLGLILFTRPALAWVESFENKDKKVAESFQPPTRFTRFVRRLRHGIITAAVMGAIAWGIVIPLAAYHFEQFNPWTVPFGLLLSPVAMAALATGFAKMLLTALCPALAGTWAAGAALAASCLRHGVHWAAATPCCDMAMARPPVIVIVALYALFPLSLIHWPHRRVRLCAGCVPVGACVLFVLLPLCGGLAPVPGNSPALRITLLSVGAGQCAVIEPSGAGAVVFDAGSSTITDPLRTCIEPFLRHEQCRSIDAIYLSHGDFDHISAAGDMVPAYGVREVVTSPYFRLHAKESKPCDALLASLDRAGRSPHLILAGEHLRLGPTVQIDVLWPPPQGNYNSNNAGLVLRLVCAGRSILFPADIQEPAERELLKHPEKLRSDILIAPHHGSAELTTARFVAAVNPKVILASSDGRLTKKQRTFDQSENAWPIYRTSQYGAITIEVSREGTIHVRPYLPGNPIDLPP
ncbi:MAG TPA: ComEC/Rec2 family competence protein [Tepidisphaeraceae bacterium]